MNRLNKEAHALEDINGVRCAVVEKNVTPERTTFLKNLLELNGYTVMVAPSPPPKLPTVAKPAAPTAAVAAPPAASLPTGTDTATSAVPPAAAATSSSPAAAAPAAAASSPAPETFTVGVTDFLFHPMLAIYERALKTPEGKFVTVDYWNQQPEKEDKYYWKRDFFTDSI